MSTPKSSDSESISTTLESDDYEYKGQQSQLSLKNSSDDFYFDPSGRGYGRYHMRKKLRHEELYQYSFRRNNWRKDIINLDDDAILGLTSDDLLQLGIFYITLYVCLALLWMFLFYGVFEYATTYDYPVNNMTQPGISMEPLIIEDISHRIVYNHFNIYEISLHVNKIHQHLNKYSSEAADKYFGKCNAAVDFGYSDAEPCIFVKLNKIVHFIPLTYDSPTEFPKTAPRELIKYIELLQKKDQRNRIWLSCATNIDDIIIHYMPKRYIDGPSMVYTKTIIHEDRVTKHESWKHYNATDLERIIAVKFENVPLSKKIMVKCKFWAKNIKVVKDDFGRGCIKFYFLIN